MISDSQMRYGSLVRRQGRSRRCWPYQARTSARKAVRSRMLYRGWPFIGRAIVLSKFASEQEQPPPQRTLSNTEDSHRVNVLNLPSFHIKPTSSSLVVFLCAHFPCVPLCPLWWDFLLVQIPGLVRSA